MFRRTIGISAVAAAISIATILPAGAQTSPGIDSYAAGASAKAIDLSVFGKPFSIASTFAEVTSTPKGLAKGNALFTPLFSTPDAKAATDGKATDEACASLSDAIPPEIPLSVPQDVQDATDLVCVVATASLDNGKPASTSVGSELVLEVRAPAAIGDTAVLDDIVETVQGGLATVFDTLAPIVAPVEDAAQTELLDELQGILDGLLDEVQEGDVLVRITVAPAKSLSEATDAGITASAASNGVIVELLPNLPGGALAVATVGSATSKVVRDAVTGAPTISGGAALISLSYPNGLLGGLKLLTDAAGQPELDLNKVIGDALGSLTSALPCNGTNPLASVFCFELGAVKPLNATEAAAMGFPYGPTTVGQTTSVLSLQILSGIATPAGLEGVASSPAVSLAIGETAAAAAATTPLAKDGCVSGCSSPFDAPTGGGSSMLLTLALLGAGAGAVTLLRRSRTI